MKLNMPLAKFVLPTLLGTLPLLYAQEVSVTAPGDQRTIIGSGDDRSFDFGVSETAGNAQTVTFTPSAAYIGANAVNTPAAGQPLEANASTSVTVTPDYGNFVTGANSVGLTVSDDTNVWPAANGTFNVQGIVNRVLSGTYTSNHLGSRRVRGAIIGTIELDGGNLPDATVLTLHRLGYANFDNGLHLEYNGASDFSFDAASNQTATIDVKVMNSGQVTLDTFTPGIFSRVTTPNSSHVEFGGEEYVTAEFKTLIGTTLSSSTSYKDEVDFHQTNPVTPPTAGNAQELISSSVTLNRNSALISGEDLPGSVIDLSTNMDPISEDAFYVSNNVLSSTVVDLGRAMVGTGSDAFVNPGTYQVTITDGDFRQSNTDFDDTYTDVRLGNFNVNTGVVSASLNADVDFAGDGNTASVTLSGTNLSFDRSVQGRTVVGVDVGGNISTLENGGGGLNGEVVQSSLTLGYSRTYVLDNEVAAADASVYAVEGTDLSAHTFYNDMVERRFSPDYSSNSYTNIGVSNAFDLNGNAAAAGQESTTTIHLDASKVFAEGLAGENPDISQSYDVTVKSVRDMNLVHSDVNVVYGDQETLTFNNDNGGNSSTPQANAVLTSFSNLYQGFLPFTLEFDDAALAGGETGTATVNFQLDAPDDNGLGISYVDVVTLRFSSTYDDGDLNVAGVVGLGSNTLAGSRDEVFQYTLSKTFETSGSTGTGGGSVEIQAGASLGNQNIFYTFDDGVNTGTRLEILDSALLGETGTINIGVDELANLGASLQDAVFSDRVVGQVYDITGLDGTTHVLQLSYDETGLPYSESNVRLGWFNPGEGMWMHSVMGNSDVGVLTASEYEDGKFFDGSYLAYLGSIDFADPTLGAYGVDTDNNVAWAVVDHNSSFAVIPEIGSIFMMVIAGGCMAVSGYIRQCRRKRT